MSMGVNDELYVELHRLQQWMQTVVTHPGGIREAIVSQEARLNIEVSFDGLEDVVARSATLSGAERMAIYSRSYHTRLLQCFQAMFPSLRHALGDELFDQFAMNYLFHHPPQSYTLSELADGFPRHLAETRPDADAPPDERETWPDFIIDLATLELSFLKVYDGPGIEGHPVSGLADLRAIDDERVLKVCPVPACCLRLFAFRYPVHSYMLAVRRGDRPELPAPAESFVAMTRQDYRVRIHEITQSQYKFIQALDGNCTVGDAINRASLFDGELQVLATGIRDLLCDWMNKGFFESLRWSDKTVFV